MRISRRARYGLAAVLAVALLIAFFLDTSRQPDFKVPRIIADPEALQNPADITRFRGRYVVTELYRNRLAVFDESGLDDVEYFDPADIGQRFRSPHFLEVTPWDTLLISNGWGDSIVEISDLNGGGWREFKGLEDDELRAPHGICVDEDGWIYVGDSLNSRLVRFRDMAGTGWQVFADVDARVSYIRELVCRGGAVWASNSYENRPGLNPGQGSNVLKISDFDSGKAEIVFAVNDTNMTGILPLEESSMVVALWGAHRRIALAGIQAPGMTTFPRPPLGIPYGIYQDPESGDILVSHMGDLSDEESSNKGGIAVYR